MPQSHTPSPRSIALLDSTDFLQHDVSSGRMDKVLNGDVTVSAIPDDSGATRWEARTADGQPLRLFQLTIEPATAAHPVVIDTTEGVYVCYDDAGAMQSWCVQIKRH